jgi:hypothetical protein
MKSGARLEGGARVKLDSKTKKRLAELCTAINEAISGSESVLELTERLKEDGYQIFLFLEATACLMRREEPRSKNLVKAAAGRKRAARLRLSPEDLKFLKSLQIKVI